jgi:hypothetical protein
MSATTTHPKVFISYSWTSAEHQLFVVDLATALRGHGIDVILDKWDLKPGQDKHVFMESMVTDATVGRVLVICDRKYQEKANSRAGGVGTESQIISQEVYAKVDQIKFIPVVREFDDEGNAHLPVFLKGRIYIDISSDERYGDGLDELLRLIYEQPLHEKPKLGAPPVFVSNPGRSYVVELSAALRAIREDKPNRNGLEMQFIKGLVTELSKLYVQPEGNEYDEGVYQAIVATKGLRDQFAEYADAVSAFSTSDTSRTLRPFFSLLESLGEHFGPPPRSGQYYPGWSDFYKFLAVEVLLIQVAALLRHDQWRLLGELVDEAFIVQDEGGAAKTIGFVGFMGQHEALDNHRNRRLKLNRASVTADLLRERASPENTSFAELSQADVLLALKSVMTIGKSAATGWPRAWVPRTGIYATHGNQHKVFLRAVSPRGRMNLFSILDVSSPLEFETRISTASERLSGFQHLSLNSFHSNFNFLEAINFAGLAKPL